MIGLQDFKNKISDFARPNRFSADVYLPPNLVAPDLFEVEFLSWLVQTAAIPSRAQGEVVIKYHGMELKLPGDYSKENISLTFLNDYDFSGRNTIEKWMEFGAQRVSDTNEKTYAADMLNATIVLKQLGRTKDSVLATYKFYDVFPMKISAIDLDMSNSDQVEKFTVEFSYSYFENLDMYGEQ